MAEARFGPDGGSLAWVEAGRGRADLVVAPTDGSTPPAVVTAELDGAGVASGSGLWCWSGPEHVVVAAADDRLVRLAIGGAGDGADVDVLAEGASVRAPAVSPDGSMVAFVLEGPEACDVVVVSVEEASSPRTRPVCVSNAGFAWDPAWSPDGRRLAWHEWDLGAMSWDGSRIVVARPDGSEASVVAGGPDTSVGQPRFSPDGSLAFVSDATGWWNVWVAPGDGGDPAPFVQEPFEHCEPAWGPGQRSFAWSPDGDAIVWCRNEQGFGRLVAARHGGPARELAKGWHHGLDWGPAGVVAVRSGARTAPTVTVATDPLASGSAPARRLVATGAPAGFEAAGLVEPTPVTWAADDGSTVHGSWYRPSGSASGLDAAPPVLLDVHGGPTGQASVQWKPLYQYFVTRGWAVLAPDPRGSTGYGRTYTQALGDGWGSVDVADCAAALDAIGPAGWGDPARVAVSGSSSGALTALLLAAFHGDRLRAVISRSGVTDLLELAATTHRLEARYLDRLVGELPRAADRYRERSPVTHAGSIRVPVLVLHGDADRVVPPSQADALVGAIRAGGGTVEHHVYDGEGHSFAREDTLLDLYPRMESVLDRWVLGS